MPKRWRLFVFFIICLTASGGLLWYLSPKLPQELSDTNKLQNASPTTYFFNSKLTQYSDNGRVSYTLKAKEILYFDNDNSEVMIKTPEFEIYDEKEDANVAPWNLSSSYAEGNTRQDYWLLKDKVLLKHQTENGNWLTLTTTELLLRPQQHYAETNKAVTIKGQSSTIQAIGLKIFFDDQRIELLSNVTSQYQP